MGVVRVTTAIDILAAPADVWAVVADFARNPEWQAGMRTCEWETAPPVQVGSRCRQEATFLGRPITTTFEVVEVERTDDGGGRITIDSRESTFPLTVTRIVRALPSGTRVTAEVVGTPGGLMGRLSPLTSRMVQRSVDGDYDRLKRLLERGAT